MILFLDLLLIVLALTLLVPALVLSVECLAALLPRRGAGSTLIAPRPSIAVLIPAHNEELAIETAIQSVRSQLQPEDRLIVIADHCTDRTAHVARRAGATVIERHDPAPRGKGHALTQGLRFLTGKPPQVVAVVDADCIAATGTIDLIARQAMASGGPVQASYVLDLPPGPDLTSAVSAFAFLVRNVVRPMGLHGFGLPCHLMGTGMAFPWRVAGRASFAGDHIGDDLQLGLDLLMAGHPTRYCGAASVRSWLPPRRQEAARQRRRWEHGHLAVMLSYLPRLLAEAIRQRRGDLLAVALDLSVPPLALFMILLVGATAAAAMAAVLGAWAGPAILLAAAVGLVLAAATAAWCKFARPWLPPSALLAAPFYVLWKAPLYWEFLVRRQENWGGRTGRGGDA